MGSTCDRMGCSAPATVVFGADPGRMLVVMQAVDPSTLGNLRPGILCAEHAARLTVPRGWTLDDRREPVPRLFRLVDPPAPAPERAASRPVDPSPTTREFEQAALPEITDDAERDADAESATELEIAGDDAGDVGGAHAAEVVEPPDGPVAAEAVEIVEAAEAVGAVGAVEIAEAAEATGVIDAVGDDAPEADPVATADARRAPEPDAVDATGPATSDALEWDERDVTSETGLWDDWTDEIELDRDLLPDDGSDVEHDETDPPDAEVRELLYVRDPDLDAPVDPDPSWPMTFGANPVPGSVPGPGAGAVHGGAHGSAPTAAPDTSPDVTLAGGGDDGRQR